jgi:chlorophyll synthase
MGGIYVLNQIYDLETDRVNRKVFFLSEGLIPVPAAVVETGVLLAASLVLSLQFSRPFRTLVLASLVLSLLYCTPPIKLKGRPFLDLVANAVGYGCLALWAGWSVNAALSYRALLHSLPYAFAVGGVFSLTTVPDIPGDRAAGEFTSGVLLGVRGAAILAVVLIASSLTLSTWLRDPICALAALVPLPFYGWAAIRGDIRSCRRANWVGGLALVVLAGILFPWFLALVGCTYLALRIYYRRRFGMRYPF